MRRVHIFTYGSLMFPQVWRRVVRGRYRSAKARIHGYRRCVIKGDHYPVAVPVPGRMAVDGRIYFHVKAGDCARLDAFEGAFYQRLRLVAYPHAGLSAKAPGGYQPIACECYLLSPKHRHLASRTPWSPAKFRRYHFKSFHRKYCNRPPVA